MKLETLYKRTKTGAIQYYFVSTHPGDNESTIRKESGQLGTLSPVIHEEVIREGKNLGKSNETTAEQQADNQAKSDWKKKKDEGYKSLEDLSISEEGIISGTVKYYRLNNSESGYSLPEILNIALPQFNTDASGNVKPMLAIDWKKVKSISYPCYIQPKLDGVRCLMIVGEDTKFLSRSGKLYTTLEHIAKDIHDLLPGIEGMPDIFILDGEIYSDKLTFQEITQAVKKQCANSYKLHFRTYDIIEEGNYTSRLAIGQRLVMNIASPYIHWVSTSQVYNKAEVKCSHQLFVEQGYEGAMLRLPEGLYEQGQRSRSLLKVKEFDEAEFLLSHYELGQRIEDLIAVCWNKDRKKFRAKMMGSKTQKEKLFNDYSRLKSYQITVKYFGLTNDGLPRFPIGKTVRDYE